MVNPSIGYMRPKVAPGICAAIAGQGLALVPIEYVRQKIEEKRLVQIHDKPWPA